MFRFGGMMTKLLFGPNGRVARVPFLVIAIALHLLFAVTLWPMLTGPLSGAPEPLSFGALGRIADDPMTSLLTIAGANPIAGAPAFAFAAVVMFSFVILVMNRLRDADRSRHWTWLAFASPALLMIVLMSFPTAFGAARSVRAV